MNIKAKAVRHKIFRFLVFPVFLDKALDIKGVKFLFFGVKGNRDMGILSAAERYQLAERVAVFREKNSYFFQLHHSCIKINTF